MAAVIFRKKILSIVTARIRRMTGGYIFSLSTLAGGGGGGTPSQVWPGGGVLHLRSGGGVLHLRLGGTSSQVRGGYMGYPPYPDLGRGTPLLRPGMRYPPPRPGIGYPLPEMGYPPYLDLGQGTPQPEMGYPPTWDGVLPPPLHRSAYASTCYAAGSVPLAFTQEDFLVFKTYTPVHDTRIVNIV